MSIFVERDLTTTPAKLEFDVSAFGERVKIGLKKVNRGQVWLAKKIGISQGTISKYLGNKNATVAPVDVIAEICDALDADPNWMTYGYVPRSELWFLSKAEYEANPDEALEAAVAHMEKVAKTIRAIQTAGRSQMKPHA